LLRGVCPSGAPGSPSEVHGAKAMLESSSGRRGIDGGGEGGLSYMPKPLIERMVYQRRERIRQLDIPVDGITDYTAIDVRPLMHRSLSCEPMQLS
ncbi:MAG TPA: hypothetical protein VNN15_03960, partial [Solirubrobacterales bacterium]|nr:hypothetical protein [Solirubrobacterales bacterium]